MTCEKPTFGNQELPEECDNCRIEKDEIEAFEVVKTKPGSFQSGPGLFKKMSVILLLVGPV